MAEIVIAAAGIVAGWQAARAWTQRQERFARRRFERMRRG